MVQLNDIENKTTYLSIDTVESRVGTMCIGGLLSHGRIRYSPIIPLNTEIDSAKSNRLTLFETVRVTPTTVASFIASFEAIRQMILATLLDNYRAAVDSGQINPYAEDDAEVIGSLKLLMADIRTKIFAIANQALMSFLSAFRNEVPHMDFYCFSGRTNRNIGIREPLAPGGEIEINLPMRNNQEITAIKTAKLQFTVISRLLGKAPGWEVLHFFELAAQAGSLNDQVTEDSTTALKDDFILGMINKISKRPLVQVVPDVFAYITDRLIEICVFSYVRAKLKPETWTRPGFYGLIFQNTDADTLATIVDSWRMHFEESQVHSEAVQGGTEIYMLPVCSYSETEQVIEPGSFEVQLVRIDRIIGDPSNTLYRYLPHRINAVEHHEVITYNRDEGQTKQRSDQLEDQYYTIDSLLPINVQIMVPTEDGIRRRKDYWPLVWHTGREEYPFDPEAEDNLAWIDMIGLDTYLKGKWYGVFFDECKWTDSYSKTMWNKPEKLIYGPISHKMSKPLGFTVGKIASLALSLSKKKTTNPEILAKIKEELDTWMGKLPLADTLTKFLTSTSTRYAYLQGERPTEASLDIDIAEEIPKTSILQCPECGKVYKYNAFLKKHMKKEHGIE